MLIQMYTMQPFAREMRTSLKLPGDPYSIDDEEHEKSLAYLKSIGVVYYRDEESADGWIIDEDGKTPLEERSGFKAYRHLVVLTDNLEPITWEALYRRRLDKNKHTRITAKHGDNRVWYRFNEEVLVHEMTNTLIKCIK